MIMNLSKKLFDKLRRKAYRDEYIAEHVRVGVAMQIRTMREQRGASQAKLGHIMGTSQSAVARAEDPDYGKLSIQTLLDVARAFDVALHVQFLSFPEFIWRTRDVSPKALDVKSFDETAFAPVQVDTPRDRRIETTITAVRQYITTAAGRDYPPPNVIGADIRWGGSPVTVSRTTELTVN